jgi:hypothetical protein
MALLGNECNDAGLFSSHFYPPFVKGGWGDFGAVASGKSPSPPFGKGGNGADLSKTE